MRRVIPPIAVLAAAVLPALLMPPMSVASFPAITSVTPSSGPASGGTTVTVRGSALFSAGTPVVRFGGVDGIATTVVQMGTEYQVVTPPHAPGTVEVDLYESARVPPVIATLAGAFTYEATPAPAPAISSVSPASGPTTGGTSVTLTGTDLTGATAVSFGGTAATAFTVNGPTSITATAPARDAGAVAVSVTTPGGTATSPGAFTYVPYRTLTVRNVAATMARGDAQYGATRGDAGSFTSTSTSDGSTPVRQSGYAGGIYCGTRTYPVQLPGIRALLFPPFVNIWMVVPQVSTGTSCTAAYPAGTTVRLTALPSWSFWSIQGRLVGVAQADGLGWHSGWGGACRGTSGLTCTVTMDRDRIVSSAFGGAGLNLDGVRSGDRLVSFDASTADPETGVITSYRVGWSNASSSGASPGGFVEFTTQVVAGGAGALEHGTSARQVVCRKRTRLVRWSGRVTCPVGPALARRLADGPVRLRTTVNLRLRGRADAVTVARRTAVLRNGAGFGRVAG